MSLPIGSILLWSGAIVDIPAGFALCNGANGTPDLRDKFVVGAGSTYAVDANGGAVQHNHTFTGDGHTHGIPAGIGINPGTDFLPITTQVPATGTTDNKNHLPPYYALAYIMRV